MDNINGKKKILLVDDDEIQLSITKAILENDYEIIQTQSGKEALGYLYKGLVPDLILLDIIMPEMDGWETFNRIKSVSLLGEAHTV
jgi:CheY-like chemotaxis protein